jgi:ParB family chromosome partitioning protein
MREKGMTEEAIAAAFFVDPKVVKQRLRLVTVAPALLEVYAEDERSDAASIPSRAGMPC